MALTRHIYIPWWGQEEEGALVLAFGTELLAFETHGFD